jgi:hypothetical protein
VPENAFNPSALESLLNAGVLGLKSFMCPSGINDFPMTNSTHIEVCLIIFLILDSQIFQFFSMESLTRFSLCYDTIGRIGYTGKIPETFTYPC